MKTNKPNKQVIDFAATKRHLDILSGVLISRMTQESTEKCRRIFEKIIDISDCEDATCAVTMVSCIAHILALLEHAINESDEEKTPNLKP